MVVKIVTNVTRDFSIIHVVNHVYVKQKDRLKKNVIQSLVNVIVWMVMKKIIVINVQMVIMVILIVLNVIAIWMVQQIIHAIIMVNVVVKEILVV